MTRTDEFFEVSEKKATSSTKKDNWKNLIAGLALTSPVRAGEKLSASKKIEITFNVYYAGSKFS